MKTKIVCFGLAVLVVVIVLAANLVSAESGEIKISGEVTLFAVDSIGYCGVSDPDDSKKPACYVYVVKKGDNLWNIARRFSVRERKLSVEDLMRIPVNRYIDEREIPKNLKGYLGPPWNKVSRDWIFPGDKITIPLVTAHEMETASNENKLRNLERKNSELQEKLSTAEREIEARKAQNKSVFSGLLALAALAAILGIGLILTGRTMSGGIIRTRAGVIKKRARKS